ncbi:BTAD domain-containing putative transcriptional regulator [Longispora sp. K20-0274]|uniref:AfsR/SARP family transcriptional regulator n=1 Tax=Longispora sp. K20-0274 TaxID=3088255 RepID=UPI00399BFB79
MTEYGVLGPLVVRRDGRDVAVAAGKVRVLLAVLLLRANEPVGVDLLADRLWEGRLPAQPRRALHVYVTRLRTALGPGSVRTVAGGYQMDLLPERLDMLRFDALLAEAGTDPAGPVPALRAAVGLWRGPVCVDVDSEAVRALDAAALTERYLLARERLMDLDLDAGGHADLIGPLRELTAVHPLRERFWAQLVLALYRSGRQSEAIDAYWTITHRLAEDLGVDPGTELRELYGSLLRADPGLDAPRAGSGWTVLRTLPPEVPGFVGRAEQSRLGADRLTAGSVPLVAVTGPPGAGKSAFAARLAHRVSDRFPDGQWHLPLGTHGAAPADLAHALGDLLRASGAAHVPDDPAARTAALRDRLADRRVLILLDDVADADQVRAVLPGSPGSAVLVTSRDELRGLAAVDGAYRIELRDLDHADARALLTTMLDATAPRPAGATPGNPAGAPAAGVVGGAPGSLGDPDLGEEIIRRCGGLPLALRIAAANLAGLSGPELRAQLDELAGPDRLDALSVAGDPQATMRLAFESSYRRLPAPARRLFRLFGRVPADTLGPDGLAALSGWPVRESRAVLARLAAAHLVERDGASRYRLHDLLRVYAAEQADPTEAAEALARLRDWYVSTADAAALVVQPDLIRVSDRPDEAPPLFDLSAGRDWLDREAATMAALARHAAGDGDPDTAYRLVDCLRAHHNQVLFTEGWLDTLRIGHRAARAAGARLAEAALLAAMAMLVHTVVEPRRAAEQYAEALGLFRRLGHREGEATVLGEYGGLMVTLGEPAASPMLEEALRLLPAGSRGWVVATINLTHVLHDGGETRRAAALAGAAYRAAEPRMAHLATVALIHQAGYQAALGQSADALAGLHRALDWYRAAGDPFGETMTQLAIGRALHDGGRHAEAVEYLARVVRSGRATGDHGALLNGLVGLADAQCALGRTGLAAELHREALNLARGMGNAGVEARALVGLATALAEADPDEAVRLAADAVAFTSHRQLRHLLRRAWTVAGAAHLAAGRPEEARAAAERALGVVVDSGYPADERKALALAHRSRAAVDAASYPADSAARVAPSR